MERFALNIDGGDEYYPWNEWIFFEYESREKFLNDLLAAIKRFFKYHYELKVLGERIASINHLDKKVKVIDERLAFISQNGYSSDVILGGYDLSIKSVLPHKIVQDLYKDPELIDFLTIDDISLTFFGTIEEMFETHKIDSCEVFRHAA